jgi:hypothetical protein
MLLDHFTVQLLGSLLGFLLGLASLANGSTEENVSTV